MMKRTSATGQSSVDSRLFYQLLLISSLVFLLYFRPLHALVPRGYDGACYLEMLYRILHIPLERCSALHFPPGVMVAWIPGVVFGKLLSLITGQEVHSCIEVLIGFSSYVYWTLSLFLTVSIVKSFTTPDKVLSHSLLFFFSVPSLYYAVSITFYTHSVELFLSLLVVFFLFKKQYLFSLAAAALLSSTRFNDFPVLLVIAGCVFDRKVQGKGVKLGLAFLFIAGSSYLARVALVDGYDGNMFLLTLFRDLKVQDLERFFFSRWQGIWLNVLWVSIGVLGVTHILKLSWFARAALLWMAFNLTLSIGWNAMGFGQRYLIGTYAGALVVWLELRSILSLKAFQRLCQVGILNAILVFYVTWLSDTRFNPAWMYFKVNSIYEFFWGVLGPVSLVGLSPCGFLFYYFFPQISLILPIKPTNPLVPSSLMVGFTALTAIIAILVLIYSAKKLQKHSKS